MISISAQPVSGAQIKQARNLLGWTQQKLAMESELSIQTIRSLEAGNDQRTPRAAQLITTLKAKGVEFGNGGARLSAITPKWRRPTNDERGDPVREAGVGDHPGVRMRKVFPCK